MVSTTGIGGAGGCGENWAEGCFTPPASTTSIFCGIFVARRAKEVERVTGGLVDRVRVLEGRYAKPLPELACQVEDYGAKVEAHLKRMGVPV